MKRWMCVEVVVMRWMCVEVVVKRWMWGRDGN